MFGRKVIYDAWQYSRFRWAAHQYTECQHVIKNAPWASERGANASSRSTSDQREGLNQRAATMASSGRTENEAGGLVAVAQMTSSGNQDKNFEVCRDLAMQSSRKGCKMLFLPECCAFIGSNQQEVSSHASWHAPALLLSGNNTLRHSAICFCNAWPQTVEAAQPLDGPLMARFREVARDAQIWLSLGGFQETGPDAQHIYNTHVILDPMGNLVSRYRKVS